MSLSLLCWQLFSNQKISLFTERRNSGTINHLLHSRLYTHTPLNKINPPTLARGTSLTQSTYIYRLPQCMSTRRNWDSITPPPSRQRVCPSPRYQGGGGGHTRLRVRDWVSPNSDDLRKSLALCLLYVVLPHWNLPSSLLQKWYSPPSPILNAYLSPSLLLPHFSIIIASPSTSPILNAHACPLFSSLRYPWTFKVTVSREIAQVFFS